ncbi:hypothetical protein J6590_016055 [Homalodisca vitripennis]|nr:hypothetical protein J6590_016055 [Homalodisca vitripennis]
MREALYFTLVALEGDGTLTRTLLQPLPLKETRRQYLGDPPTPDSEKPKTTTEAAEPLLETIPNEADSIWTQLGLSTSTEANQPLDEATETVVDCMSRYSIYFFFIGLAVLGAAFIQAMGEVVYKVIESGNTSIPVTTEVNTLTPSLS